MNILQIRGDFSDNGPGTQMLTISEELRERGHNVEIASSYGLLDETIIKKGFILHSIEKLARKKRTPYDIISAIITLRKLLKSRNIEVIHAHNAATLYIAFFASLMLKNKIKLFHSCRGIELRANYKWRNLIYINYPGKVFAVSEFTKKELEKIGLSSNRIIVTFNGVDLKRFDITKKNEYRNEIRKEFNIPSDATVIGIIGKMGTKGHDELIKVFSEIQNDYPKLYFLLVGGGGKLNEFVNLAKTLNVNSRLIFAGLRFESEKFNAAFDIFALPTYWGEMFPNAILEALAFATPVISTKLSGIPEIIANGEGFIIEPKDTNALKEKIILLLNDQELRVALGKNGRETLINKFTIEKVVDRIEDAYLKL